MEGGGWGWGGVRRWQAKAGQAALPPQFPLQAKPCLKFSFPECHCTGSVSCAATQDAPAPDNHHHQPETNNRLGRRRTCMVGWCGWKWTV